MNEPQTLSALGCKHITLADAMEMLTECSVSYYLQDLLLDKVKQEITPSQSIAVLMNVDIRNHWQLVHVLVDSLIESGGNEMAYALLQDADNGIVKISVDEYDDIMRRLCSESFTPSAWSQQYTDYLYECIKRVEANGEHWQTLSQEQYTDVWLLLQGCKCLSYCMKQEGNWFLC